MTTHSAVEGLLGAYALHAVDDDEALLVADHLRECARCRGEVENHRQAATFLGDEGSPAPERIWERIAGSLEAPAPVLNLAMRGGAKTSTRSARHTGRRRRLWAAGRRAALATLAAALIVIVGLGIQVRNQDQQIDTIEAVLDRNPLARAYEVALAAPDSQVVDLLSLTDGSPVARVAVGADGTGYMNADGLPPLPEDRTYQLWGTVDDRRVSLAVLGPDPRVVSFTSSSRFVGLAVTEEAAPGVTVTDQPALIYGPLAPRR